MIYTVLSPAKKLDFENPLPDFVQKQKGILPHYPQKTEKLLAELQSLNQKELAKLMSLSTSLASLNFDRYKNFATLPSRFSVYAFKGDTYKGLKAETWGEEHFKNAQEVLFILSGLYGVLSPHSLIRPHRLEMGTSFSDFSLYDFWQKPLLQYFSTRLNPQEDALLVLASKEYFNVLKGLEKTHRLVHFTFLQGEKNIGIFAKQARGMMASYVLKNKLYQLSLENFLEKIQTFKEEGYQFSKKHSSLENLSVTFIRKE